MASSETSEISSPWPMSDDLKEPSPPFIWKLLGLPWIRLHGIHQQDSSRMIRPRGNLSKKSQVRSEATAYGNVQHTGEVSRASCQAQRRKQEWDSFYVSFSSLVRVKPDRLPPKFPFPSPATQTRNPRNLLSRAGLRHRQSFRHRQANLFPHLPLHEEGTSELASRLPAGTKSGETCLLPTQNLLLHVCGGGK